MTVVKPYLHSDYLPSRSKAFLLDNGPPLDSSAVCVPFTQATVAAPIFYRTAKAGTAEIQHSNREEDSEDSVNKACSQQRTTLTKTFVDKQLHPMVISDKRLVKQRNLIGLHHTIDARTWLIDSYNSTAYSKTFPSCGHEFSSLPVKAA